MDEVVKRITDLEKTAKNWGCELPGSSYLPHCKLVNAALDALKATIKNPYLIKTGQKTREEIALEAWRSSRGGAPGIVTDQMQNIQDRATSPGGIFGGGHGTSATNQAIEDAGK
jgi:hypothetical protein